MLKLILLTGVVGCHSASGMYGTRYNYGAQSFPGSVPPAQFSQPFDITQDAGFGDFQKAQQTADENSAHLMQEFCKSHRVINNLEQYFNDQINQRQPSFFAGASQYAQTHHPSHLHYYHHWHQRQQASPSVLIRRHPTDQIISSMPLDQHVVHTPVAVANDHGSPNDNTLGSIIQQSNQQDQITTQKQQCITADHTNNHHYLCDDDNDDEKEEEEKARDTTTTFDNGRSHKHIGKLESKSHVNLVVRVDSTRDSQSIFLADLQSDTSVGNSPVETTPSHSVENGGVGFAYFEEEEHQQHQELEQYDAHHSRRGRNDDWDGIPSWFFGDYSSDSSDDCGCHSSGYDNDNDITNGDDANEQNLQLRLQQIWQDSFAVEPSFNDGTLESLSGIEKEQPTTINQNKNEEDSFEEETIETIKGEEYESYGPPVSLLNDIDIDDDDRSANDDDNDDSSEDDLIRNVIDDHSIDDNDGSDYVSASSDKDEFDASIENANQVKTEPLFFSEEERKKIKAMSLADISIDQDGMIQKNHKDEQSIERSSESSIAITDISDDVSQILSFPPSNDDFEHSSESIESEIDDLIHRNQDDDGPLDSDGEISEQSGNDDDGSDTASIAQSKDDSKEHISMEMITKDGLNTPDIKQSDSVELVHSYVKQKSDDDLSENDDSSEESLEKKPTDLDDQNGKGEDISVDSDKQHSGQSGDDKPQTKKDFRPENNQVNNGKQDLTVMNGDNGRIKLAEQANDQEPGSDQDVTESLDRSVNMNNHQRSDEPKTVKCETKDNDGGTGNSKSEDCEMDEMKDQVQNPGGKLERLGISHPLTISMIVICAGLLILGILAAILYYHKSDNRDLNDNDENDGAHHDCHAANPAVDEVESGLDIEVDVNPAPNPEEMADDKEEDADPEIVIEPDLSDNQKDEAKTKRDSFLSMHRQFSSNTEDRKPSFPSEGG